MKLSPRDKSKSYRETATRANNGNNGHNRMKSAPSPARLWPALVALNGFGLAVNQASALELGELTVHSTLGQPLRASIAYALAPNEMIESHCIFLRPPASATGMPFIRNATASASNGTIRLAGSVPIREPILGLSLTVDCPGAANLGRQYTVFVDPPNAARAAAAQESPAPVAATVREAVTAAPARRPARAATADATPISGQNTYRVQPGDTLSGIAARIADRDISLWQAVDVIFAANPDAFIDNDRNLLKAGSLLVLPDMGTVTTAQPVRTPEPRGAVTTAQDAAPSTPAEAAEPPRPDAAGEPARTTAATTQPAAVAEPHSGESPADADNPFVSPTAQDADSETQASGTGFAPAREVIPDTEVDATSARQLTPRVSVAPTRDSDGLNSLAWLGGTGIAIILALLLFGRQLKNRFGSPGELLPAGVSRGRRRTDGDDDATTETTLRDEDPTDTFESPARAEPVALDADLGTGSGFDDDGEIDVAQDFGFSTSRDLYGDVDLELPEAAARDDSQGPTDIIPPKRFEDRRFTDTVIVEKEIPPSDDTGEYDLSMIVDATRQPIADVEDTTKDLRAVQVDTGDNEALDSDSLTLSREVDYKILEQDYEDELTATQAFNAKLMREAELLKKSKQAIDVTELFEASEQPTAEYAVVDEDLTRELPGNDDRTVEMPLDQEPVAAEAPDTLEDSGVNAEVTTELPTADNDETVDIDIESATVDTKKLRAS